MRAILFRAKRQEPGDEGNGVWCYGDIVHMPNNQIMLANPRYWDYLDIMESPADPLSQAFFGMVDPKTVGQFTGICDKRGTKVFEGDRCRVERPCVIEYGEITFNNGCFWFDTKGVSGMMRLFDVVPNGFEIEVVGNIHEKKEGGDQDGRT